jgi:hypothetical protein
MAMPLWRRGPGGEHPHTPAPAIAAVVEPAAAAPDPPPGDLPCAATGCAETTGVRCAYVDRRERGCATAWCPAHRELAGGHVYCRRHAVLIRAIAAGAGVPWLPDVDSRAPSLVEWLANDLGDASRRAEFHDALLGAVRRGLAADTFSGA